MTTLTITLTGICSGGGHHTYTLSGDKSKVIHADRDEMNGPIEDEELIAFCKVIRKMAKNGRTVNQARQLLQAGVEVTV